MEIKAYKGAYGWEAQNIVPVPELGEDKAIVILTMKRYNGALATNAQVATVKGFAINYEVFGDFRKFLVVKQGARATQKAVNELQAAAVAMVPELIESAKAFYAEKQKKLEAEGPFTVLAGA